jgi:Fic family protein
VLVERFGESPVGRLVEIRGHDARLGEDYEHWAFVPKPLPASVQLSAPTWGIVSEAMLALGRLDQAGQQIPNPSLLSRPTLRREAQSTSALEGTYAPLTEVLEADLEEAPARSPQITEIRNYILSAEHAFGWVAERPITTGLLLDVHRLLVKGTPGDGSLAGRIRSIQVVIGPPGSHVAEARFVPPPPGADLDQAVHDWVTWVNDADRDLPPVVDAALAHYQIEALHPFNDGNGRIGRLLIVLQLMRAGVLREPILTVSPWFETRRRDYQDELQRVSETGDFSRWVAFFAEAIRAQAESTALKVDDLLALQEEMRTIARQHGLRGVAADIVEGLIGQPIVTPKWAAKTFGVTYQAGNNAVGRLVDIGLLREITGGRYGRVFAAADVIQILEA